MSENPKNENELEEMIKAELNSGSTEDEAYIQSLPSNVSPLLRQTGTFEKGDMSPVVTEVMYNPQTGVGMPVFESENSEYDEIDAMALLDKFMSSNTVTEEGLKAAMKRLDEGHDDFAEISLEDLSIITALVNDHLNRKIKTDGEYLERLPKFFVQTIFGSYGKGLSLPITVKVSTAKRFVEQLTTEYITNDSSADLDNMIGQMREAQKELNEKINSLEAGMHVSLVTKSMELIKSEYDKLSATKPLDLNVNRNELPVDEDIIKANNLLDIYNGMYESIHLTLFKEFCKRVKIKKYELERPDKVFLSFNRKYFDHKRNINDIRATPQVLCRHIKNNDDGVYKVCLAFCKYCLNFTPNNNKEHANMYYFVKNVLIMDLLCPNGIVPVIGESESSISEEALSMYTTFLSNIKECISYIK